MLAHILAVLVGTGSVGLYISAFFFPEIHRKQDFIWSGVGFLYALTLWIYARQMMGGILVGQISSVALIGWFGWQTLKLRQQLAPVSPQPPTAGTTKLRERLGLNRSTVQATKPTPAPTPAKTTEPVTPPLVKNSLVQPSVSQKTAPVESIPSTKNPIVQPVSQKATPTQSVPLSPPKNSLVQPSSTPKTAPVESNLPPARQISQPAKSQPETETDLAPTLRVDVVESTEKAWIKLEVKSSPATKPLGTAVKPPTPLLLSAASNPDPQPPAIVAEDLATTAPTDAISSQARLDEDWE